MHFWLHVMLEKQHLRGGAVMKTMSAVAAAQTTSPSSCEVEKSAQSLKVFSHRRPSAVALRAMAYSTMCLLAA